MKVVLYMAMTLDGFVAKKDGDSDWVSPVDSKIFEQKIHEAGCIILGRKTFEQYQGELYPVAGVLNIILTTNKRIKFNQPNVIYVLTPLEATKLAQEKGYDNALLIGGGTTNGLFLKENLIDEIFLTIYPLIFGNGIKLFANIEKETYLKLVSQKDIGEGLNQLHYRILK